MGLKCGLEVHQQLETRKLFCSCPSQLREDKPDVIVRRKLRVVPGELGEVDLAAAHEMLKGKEFVYEAYSDTTCLVELDEEPPHPLNIEALEIAVEIALLLGAKLVDEVQVMRKTVIDGSNPSGFQRTMLVATDGCVRTSRGAVKIKTICLEEDAARKIKEEDGRVYYRLDRLGISLVEIATDASIKSPEHAREVAERIGLALRLTGRVKRGIGTIRQDVNVSLPEGARVEIKGVQELALLPKVIRYEVERQKRLSKLREEALLRGLREEMLVANFVDITEVFKGTKSKLVSSALEKGGVVLAAKLRSLKGLLKAGLGKELADYASTYSRVKGIIHSDELPAYGISTEEVETIKRKLEVSEEDAFVIAVEAREEAEKALGAVVERCKQLLRGVPEETRKAMLDGTTCYMRPLPGAARMYPETDELFVRLEEGWVEKIKRRVPNTIDEVLEELANLGVKDELAAQLIKEGRLKQFLKLRKEFPAVRPSILASTLVLAPKEAERRFGAKLEGLRDEHFEAAIAAVAKGLTTHSLVAQLLAELSKTPEASVEELISSKGLKAADEAEVRRAAEELLRRGVKKEELFGRVMSELRGRADPELVKKVLNSL